MRFEDKAGGVNESGGGLKLEPELALALRDFRLSVQAWSAAAYSRPRKAAATARRSLWRLASAWALGCALLAAGVSSGIYHHGNRQQAVASQLPRQEMKVASRRAAEPERSVVERPDQRANKVEEDLLAKVDGDVSRQVPAVMEPLAQLMDGDVTE
jgi:hypothetical protein